MPRNGRRHCRDPDTTSATEAAAAAVTAAVATSKAEGHDRAAAKDTSGTAIRDTSKAYEVLETILSSPLTIKRAKQCKNAHDRLLTKKMDLTASCPTLSKKRPAPSSIPSSASRKSDPSTAMTNLKVARKIKWRAVALSSSCWKLSSSVFVLLETGEILAHARSKH